MRATKARKAAKIGLSIILALLFILFSEFPTVMAYSADAPATGENGLFGDTYIHFAIRQAAEKGDREFCSASDLQIWH